MKSSRTTKAVQRMLRSTGRPSETPVTIGGRMAKKKKQDAVPVEGQAARPRLDRPQRRAEGGPVISDESKKEAARMKMNSLISNVTGGVASGFGGAGLLEKGMRAKGRAAIPLALGLGFLGKGSKDSNEASRIEKGQAEPGKEDRKKGGRVCK